MPAALANSVGLSGASMPGHSQTANISARAKFRKSGNAFSDVISQYAIMGDIEDDDDKNGGPNHLRAWRLYRKMKGAQLAAALDITPGQVSELENSKRTLSAKWLRRIAPALRTTPGALLDHDPNDIDNDLLEIWLSASDPEKRQISKLAAAIINDGTNG